MLTSCSYLTGFLFCMVTGTMADRMGIKKVLVIGLAISAVGAILHLLGRVPWHVRDVGHLRLRSGC